MNRPMTLEEAHTRGYELVREHSTRFTDHLATLTSDDLARRVPDSDWTAGEVIAHVRSVYERYTINPVRSPSPSLVAEQNAAEVARIGVDVGAAVASIAEQVDRMSAVPAAVAPTQEFPFHGGMTITIAGGWGNLLGELLAHGDDIGRATGKPFRIPSADLEIVLRFTTPVLGGWLSPHAATADESWDLRFPFGLIRFTFAGGTLHQGTDVEPRPTHHAIDVPDAAEWLLTTPYRRREPADDLTARLTSMFVAI